MKRFILAICAVFLLTVNAQAMMMADTILLEDFEDANVSYTTSVPEFTDGYYDFFMRTDGSDMRYAEYQNVQGSYYFAGMDLDAEGATLPLTMTFSGIDISGYTNLVFTALIAEDDSYDGLEDWDELDSVKIEYQIDGNGYQNLLAFENDGSTYNSAAFVDSDFDGTGDGTELTDTFTEFCVFLSATGQTMDLKITFDLDSGDEDIAFDDITLCGTPAAVPVPGAVILLGSGLIAAAGIRRKDS